MTAVASLRPLRARRESRREDSPRRRQRVAPLDWPMRPRKQRCDYLGIRHRWISRCGTYRIDRYPGGSGRYIAFFVGEDRPLSNHRKLESAKRTCLAHLRKRGDR